MLTWHHYLLLMTVCTVSLSSSSHSSCRAQMSNSGVYFFPAEISDSVVGTSTGGCSEAACVQLHKLKLKTVGFFIYILKPFQLPSLQELHIIYSSNTQTYRFHYLLYWFHDNYHASVTRNC